MITDISFRSETSDKGAQQHQCLFNGWSTHYVQENQAENNRQNQQFIQINDFSNKEQVKDKEQNENDKQLFQQEKQSILSQPKTIILFQDTLVSKDLGSQGSKASQLTYSVQNQSYSGFLLMKQTVYELHQKNYEQLCQIINQFFSQRINNFNSVYLTFLKVKIEQQKLYTDMNLEKNRAVIKRQKQITESVYINCKSLTFQMKRKSQQQCQKSKIFIQGVNKLYQQTFKMFQQVRILFKTKVQFIRNILKKIKDIKQQMETTILLNQKSKCTKFFGNSYMISKHLVQREKLYLQLLKRFTKQIINFLNIICRQIQPKMSLSIKQMLIAYVKLQNQYRQTKNNKILQQYQALISLNCQDKIFQELIGILGKIIPKNLIKSSLIVKQGTNDQYLQCMIQKLNMDVQTFIFLPGIQIDSSNITYSSVDKVKVLWKRQKQQCKEINLYLSSQGHIIFEAKKQDKEQDDFLAVLRINGIKFSKKNNKILLANKTKGMLEYLLSDIKPLGQLIFEPINLMKKSPLQQKFSLNNTQYADQFISSVKVLLKQKKWK